MYKYDWSLVISTKDINEKVDVFLRITNALINESHAEKTVESYDKDKPFITQKIKSLMIKRAELSEIMIMDILDITKAYNRERDSQS